MCAVKRCFEVGLGKKNYFISMFFIIFEEYLTTVFLQTDDSGNFDRAMNKQIKSKNERNNIH
ncbi:hypothetical protein B0A58_14575 [Flavobacterium branchiophilum NBRC 15030 = ATCC 35035]|uniref:Uncharacterized protein n=1 Tax=Flavobacterium branchiophilum TaxID=55197 RepID=A0A543G757_9FLAO|nr:hypothetical protein B0A58_14575 [Flavobacterium branchiophilum NBRC 15030 = ATCC 35035]TQM41774.1 hypothetical protein BC670_2776 [Flavobacterium branchiophilum]GEM56228.1 hypothetical protein FB1_24490 [Flavobacterium branchiophilum NBRC 15030 = ATCC 35035]